jgi:hypothetical protein
MQRTLAFLRGFSVHQSIDQHAEGAEGVDGLRFILVDLDVELVLEFEQKFEIAQGIGAELLDGDIGVHRVRVTAKLLGGEGSDAVKCAHLSGNMAKRDPSRSLRHPAKPSQNGVWSR